MKGGHPCWSRGILCRGSGPFESFKFCSGLLAPFCWISSSRSTRVLNLHDGATIRDTHKPAVTINPLGKKADDDEEQRQIAKCQEKALGCVVCFFDSCPLLAGCLLSLLFFLGFLLPVHVPRCGSFSGGERGIVGVNI